MLAPQAARGTNEAFSTTKTFRGYCVARITSGRAARLSDGVASGGDHTRLSYPRWPDNWQQSGYSDNEQSEGKMNYIERYWRDATPEDAIKEPPMVARFRDKDEGVWHFDTLSGWNCRSRAKWLSGVLSWQFCQVYDAPDPGEGWRLIDVDKEQPEEDDQYLCPIRNVWHFCNEWLRRVSYSKDSVVRRRIEQPNTEPKYVPFTWEDREQLRGRWYRVTLSYGEIRECQIEFFRLDRGVFFVGSFPSEQLLEKGAIFLDTGKPVGKEVTQ